MWDISTGLIEIRRLEHWFAARGFHCALGGSVMYQSYSKKDLDVIVYPHDTRMNLTADNIWTQFLTEFPSQSTGCCSTSDGSDRDCKDVRWYHLPDGKRIDFIFLK